MRTIIDIPQELAVELQKYTGQQDFDSAIRIILQDYVLRRQTDDILALRGKISIDYDWEREEEIEMSKARNFDHDASEGSA